MFEVERNVLYGQRLNELSRSGRAAARAVARRYQATGTDDWQVMERNQF